MTKHVLPIAHDRGGPTIEAELHGEETWSNPHWSVFKTADGIFAYDNDANAIYQFSGDSPDGTEGYVQRGDLDAAGWRNASPALVYAIREALEGEPPRIVIGTPGD